MEEIWAKLPPLAALPEPETIWDNCAFLSPDALRPERLDNIHPYCNIARQLTIMLIIMYAAYKTMRSVVIVAVCILLIRILAPSNIITT